MSGRGRAAGCAASGPCCLRLSPFGSDDVRVTRVQGQGFSARAQTSFGPGTAKILLDPDASHEVLPCEGVRRIRVKRGGAGWSVAVLQGERSNAVAPHAYSTVEDREVRLTGTRRSEMRPAHLVHLDRRCVHRSLPPLVLCEPYRMQPTEPGKHSLATVMCHNFATAASPVRDAEPPAGRCPAVRWWAGAGPWRSMPGRMLLQPVGTP